MRNVDHAERPIPRAASSSCGSSRAARRAPEQHERVGEQRQHEPGAEEAVDRRQRSTPSGLEQVLHAPARAERRDRQVGADVARDDQRQRRQHRPHAPPGQVRAGREPGQRQRERDARRGRPPTASPRLARAGGASDRARRVPGEAARLSPTTIGQVRPAAAPSARDRGDAQRSAARRRRAARRGRRPAGAPATGGWRGRRGRRGHYRAPVSSHQLERALQVVEVRRGRCPAAGCPPAARDAGRRGTPAATGTPWSLREVLLRLGREHEARRTPAPRPCLSLLSRMPTPATLTSEPGRRPAGSRISTG